MKTMNYYITITDEETGLETILTKPADESAARFTASRWKATLEMKNLSVKPYNNGSEYRRLMSAQSKRRKKR
jgi:hypothetical protein